MYLLKRP
jgi:hypothetical protein